MSEFVYDPEVMGGALVFRGTRVSVKRIGELALRGISRREIREDYPTISDEDIERAVNFVRQNR